LTLKSQNIIFPNNLIRRSATNGKAAMTLILERKKKKEEQERIGKVEEKKKKQIPLTRTINSRECYIFNLRIEIGEVTYASGKIPI
jgi:hypothetical protein